MASQEADPTNIKEDIKKKPGPNNPEEATRFVQEVDKAVQKFTDTVHQYEPYLIQMHIQTSLRDTTTYCVKLKITTKMPPSLMFLNSSMIQLVNPPHSNRKRKN